MFTPFMWVRVLGGGMGHTTTAVIIIVAATTMVAGIIIGIEQDTAQTYIGGPAYELTQWWSLAKT